MSRSAAAKGNGRTWKNSLYARAALFLALGVGTLVGAVVTLSTKIVEESVDRLLGERIDLAETTGALLETWLRSDLERIAAESAPAFEAQAAGSAGAVNGALGRLGRKSIFDLGLFALDPTGAPIADVPDPRGLASSFDLAALSHAAADRTAASPLLRLSSSQTPALALLAPVHGPGGKRVGFVGGALEPSTTAIVEMLIQSSRGKPRINLLDSTGTVVATTDRRELYRRADHAGVVADALGNRREFRGRCHSCHEENRPVDSRTTDVMAFAPFPSLELGIAVYQPEGEALAPAFALRTRLMWLGSVFISLFVIFAGLSVRSVVWPVTRLTREVRALRGTEDRRALSPLGNDEVGELAAALELWRTRLLDSLDRRHQQQQYLQRVLAAQEDERARVAREIHDSIAQDLAALRLEMERLAKRAEAAPVHPQLEDLERRAHDILEALRNVLLGLRLTVLENLGFLAALQSHVDRVQRERRFRGVLVIDVQGEEVDLGYEMAVTLFRIFQEAVQNVVQHAHASHAMVTVAFRQAEVELVVEDDGCGFDLASVRVKRPESGGRGLGLLGIEERATLLGGNVEIQSVPGEGTMVRVVAPIGAARQANAAVEGLA